MARSARRCRPCHRRRRPYRGQHRPSWIGVNAVNLFGKATGRAVGVVNDADAAGIAEVRFGAGADRSGVVIVVTLGTGIGSGLFVDGKLVANTELGHLHLHHGDAEECAVGCGPRARQPVLGGVRPSPAALSRAAPEPVLAGSDHHRRRHQQEGRQIFAAHHDRHRGRSGQPAERRGHRRRRDVRPRQLSAIAATAIAARPRPVRWARLKRSCRIIRASTTVTPG